GAAAPAAARTSRPGGRADARIIASIIGPPNERRQELGFTGVRVRMSSAPIAARSRCVSSTMVGSSRNDTTMTTLSILDLAFVPEGGTPADALRHTLDLARHAERLGYTRSEEHTSELQSRENLVCRLLLEKKKK